MLALVERWKLHRLLVDRIGYFRPFSSGSGVRKVLFLSERGEIPAAQVFPLFLYARDLMRRRAIEVREYPLTQFLAGRNPYDHSVDAVCFQTRFDLTRAQLENVVARIKLAWPGAQLAYFDWFAPTDLRYAETLYSHIAAYVKKQTFRDFSLYGQPTIGDTYLSNYYAKRFNLDLPKVRFEVPAGFEQKIVLGSGFEYSPLITRNLTTKPQLNGRNIDLHARLSKAHKKKDKIECYGYIRQEALDKVAELKSEFAVASDGYVPRRQFFAELRNSKMCFSPFGYGEICWRDFEAMCTGALLLKPDVSHLRLVNDPFRPYETYVPLAWDLSDLHEKAEHYRHHSAERETIARNAFALLSDHLREKRFLDDVEPLWRLLHLS